MMIKKNQPKYSYSRLSCYKQCGFSYKLKYLDKKYIGAESLNTELGSLVHKMEEIISEILKAGRKPNYDKLREYAHSVNIPKKNAYDTEGGIFGIDILSKKYLEEWYKPSDKTGMSYAGKVNDYLDHGIKHQEELLAARPDLEIWDVEHPFEFTYNGEVIKGFIDRVLKYKNEDRYIVHDIKTRDRLFDKTDTVTPLQHVIYCMALQQELKLKETPDECYYDLVFINEMQPAGTKGFIKRGMTALDKIFGGIHEGVFEPHPSPLCYWCEYSNTNPNVTAEGKNQCPYYSLWTPEESTFATNEKWEGPEKVEEHLAKLKEQKINENKWSGFML